MWKVEMIQTERSIDFEFNEQVIKLKFETLEKAMGFCSMILSSNPDVKLFVGKEE